MPLDASPTSPTSASVDPDALDGLLVARHVSGLIRGGDCLAVVVTEVATPRIADLATARPAPNENDTQLSNEGKGRQ